jgi:hypothetical protein
MIAAALAAVVVTVSPNPSRFGQLVDATVHGAGPAPSFKPFLVRAQHGNRYVLQCLDAACVPGPGPRVLRVAGTRVVIRPRTTNAEVAKPLRSFRRQTQIPPTTYRVRPAVLRTVLAVAVAALLALAVVLLLPVVRKLVPEPRDDRTPLERALALVRASLRRDAPDRRRALDVLARALAGRAAARDALDLAWSRPAPDEKRVEHLLEEVERG